MKRKTTAHYIVIYLFLYFEVFVHIMMNKVKKVVKVAFSQKGLMRSSFLQIDEPNYFPELEF